MKVCSSRFRIPRFARHAIVFCVCAAALFPSAAHAAEGPPELPSVSATFLGLVILLLAAKLSSLVERIGQPAVLGELVAGVALGNFVLLGLPWLEPIKNNEHIRFLSELGIAILLFQVGLESDLAVMRRVGLRAFLVACVGVAAPFALGAALVGPLLLPELPVSAYLFIGATLTATSVGITARVFRDLGKLGTSESQIVLGAAVIDDVLGLIILAVVSAIVETGTVQAGDVAWISAKAIIFLGLAIAGGQVLAPFVGRAFSRIHTGVGMKFTLAISIGLLSAVAAEWIGLAPIVGAFAAGLALDPVHFRSFDDARFVRDIQRVLDQRAPELLPSVQNVLDHHNDRHVQDLIEPVGMLLVPIFFVLTGMDVRLDTLADTRILLVGLGLTLVALAGKIVAGAAAGAANKWVVGWGMVPRGEVGLIFAATGRALGVVGDDVFSMIIIVVIVSTLVTPPVLKMLIDRQTKQGG